MKSMTVDILRHHSMAAALSLLFLVVLLMPLDADEKGDLIVARMDEKLNFTECRMVVRIEDVKADGKLRMLKANIEYLKDVGTRMDFIEPVRDRGKCVLMLGSSMWMSSPSVSRPVRLSGKDSFMGTSFTNDDLLNLDKNDDYDSVISSSDNSGWNIMMIAKSNDLPYPKIEARIGTDYLPVSMVYFARSGRESKRVVFSELKDFDGKPRPSVMSIVDLMKPGDTSSIIFESIKEVPVNRSRLVPAAMGK